MPGSASATAGLRGVRVPALAGLLAASAAAWGLLVWLLPGMTMSVGGPGAALGFVWLWVLMMAAMMLPTIWRVALVYLMAAAARGRRGLWVRVGGLTLGYVAVWALTALPALPVAWAFAWLAEERPGAWPWVAGLVLAGGGAFQFSGLKDRCLDHCRSPLAFAAQAAGRRGRLRDVRAGAAHGVYCLGCCAGLMVALVVLGAMNVAVMLAVAAVVLLEKTWRHGRAVGLAAGAVLVAMGVFMPVSAALTGARVVPAPHAHATHR